MQRNPFSPPEAVVVDSPPDVVRKPASAWGVQIAISMMATLLLLIFIGSLARLAAASHPAWGHVAVGAGIRILVFVAMVQGALGTQRRQARGRWLGLLFIASLMGLVLMVGWTNLRDMPQRVAPGDAAYHAGEVVGSVGFMLLGVVGLAWWFRAFGFSSRARAWFASSR